jgi:hypothetical protein
MYSVPRTYKGEASKGCQQLDCNAGSSLTEHGNVDVPETPTAELEVAYIRLEVLMAGKIRTAIIWDLTVFLRNLLPSCSGQLH